MIMGRESDQEYTYEIRLAGTMDTQWSNWFDDLTISESDGDTVLTGTIADQAALHGLLIKIFGLGMPLLSVNRKREV